MSQDGVDSNSKKNGFQKLMYYHSMQYISMGKIRNHGLAED